MFLNQYVFLLLRSSALLLRQFPGFRSDRPVKTVKPFFFSVPTFMLSILTILVIYIELVCKIRFITPADFSCILMLKGPGWVVINRAQRISDLILVKF